MKEKEKSLLEIAIELLNGKQKPQKIGNIVREVMELKGLKGNALKEATPQFILDFMQCGYFVYCGDDNWDLKDRQSTSILDKDGHDYENIYDDDEEVKKNELRDEDIYATSLENDDLDDDEDDDDDSTDDDDLSSEFELKAEEELDSLFADQEQEDEEE